VTLDSSLETAGAHARRVVVVGAGSHDQLGVVRRNVSTTSEAEAMEDLQYPCAGRLLPDRKP
jgi:hypothetical protein